ncbi:hypothetical protein [Desulfoluna spongiiphila]|uniref:Uncharacterized protein n=1 Tax=Desulfoluna spongiiphila TaxID=419481 RepID=A0A1G5JAB5_9BACT|nr:hypothetical protein [Desulfoluna spongiiphila]SCY84861.1 hypothetical protein SAMN05216233_12658 [Desulfoluna spongiiphila]VVS91000.1 hypothetical protein DBB_5680 [Desulfoluna spongiiphila]
MDSINAIFSKHPDLLSLFVITPDESVDHSRSNGTNQAPPCPLPRLNRLYHEAVRLLPESREVHLALGATCLTLRPLPLAWILAVHHQPDCGPAPIDALQEATRGLPKSAEDLHEEAFSILTPEALIAGELSPWLLSLMKLLEKVTGAPPQVPFHEALNRWIDREDPGLKVLPHFAAILAKGIDDPGQRRVFAEKAKEIFTSGEKKAKGKRTP